MEFKTGDKVVVVTNFRESNVDFKVGQTGTVVKGTYSSMMIAIDWDFPDNNFHSCEGYSKNGCGYFISDLHGNCLKITQHGYDVPITMEQLYEELIND